MQKKINKFKQETAYVWVLNTYKGKNWETNKVQVHMEVEGLLAIIFRNYTSPPLAAVEKMSGDFPDLIFEMTYEDVGLFCEVDFVVMTQDDIRKIRGTAIFSKGKCLSHEGGDNWEGAIASLKKYAEN